MALLPLQPEEAKEIGAALQHGQVLGRGLELEVLEARSQCLEGFAKTITMGQRGLIS